MGLEGAVKLGYRKELEAIADPAERRALFDKMVAAAYARGKALSTATYFEVDDVIDPGRFAPLDRDRAARRPAAPAQRAQEAAEHRHLVIFAEFFSSPVIRGRVGRGRARNDDLSERDHDLKLADAQPVALPPPVSSPASGEKDSRLSRQSLFEEFGHRLQGLPAFVTQAGNDVVTHGDAVLLVVRLQGRQTIDPGPAGIVGPSIHAASPGLMVISQVSVSSAPTIICTRHLAHFGDVERDAEFVAEIARADPPVATVVDQGDVARRADGRRPTAAADAGM